MIQSPKQLSSNTQSSFQLKKTLGFKINFYRTGLSLTDFLGEILSRHNSKFVIKSFDFMLRQDR
jgi:hypothetical protein